MSTIAALLPPVKIARRLEAALDALRDTLDADPKLAFLALANACHDAIDGLDHFDLPPVSGSAPDDYEPTPIDVLALDAPAPFVPSIQDWIDFHNA